MKRRTLKRRTMKRVSFRQELKGGDRRSIGNSNRVAAAVLQQPRRAVELIQCLWSEDPLLRMRAADAVEKVSVSKPELLNLFKAELLGLAEEATQAELRWHFALMLPRLPLSITERERVRCTLRRYLTDRSSIVKTFALQGMAELASGDATSWAEAIDLLERACRRGTPAMKARSRQLLKQFQKP
jgi:hypothetical protein